MVAQTRILHRIMMSTLIMGDVEASTSIYIKETIQEIDAHHMFDTNPKSVLLDKECLRTHVYLNNPLVFSI